MRDLGTRERLKRKSNRRNNMEKAILESKAHSFPKIFHVGDRWIKDIFTEEEELLRTSISGIPEWYKKKLAENSLK